MLKRIYALGIVLTFGLLFAPIMLARYAAPQGDLDVFKDNSCVTCHANDMSSANVTNRYLQWHLSKHKDTGVSCDKCHGGDPTTRNKDKSHTGVLPTADLKSKTHPANLSTTCKACHAQFVDSFEQSTHAKKLKDSGLGPSCNTCHEHMASSVVLSPPDGAALCAHCHTDADSTMAKRPDIPARAQEAMEALERANGMVVWAQGLVDAAKDRKLDVSLEEKDLMAVKTSLTQAKADWHNFTLTGVKEKANASFETGVKVKDRLRKKMGFN